MPLNLLTYEELDAEVDEMELSKDPVKELFTTYADFFTLPILDARRFRSEVLLTNKTMKNLSRAFDDLAQKIGNSQVNAQIPGLPSKDYREDNIADQINIKYINSILGGYLDNGQLAGLTAGNAKPLLQFFAEFKVHWKFIIYYESALKEAAKTWYEQYAKEIQKENKRYLNDHLNEKRLLKKAALFGSVFDNEEEKERFLNFAKEKLSDLDPAQAHRTFKKALKAKLSMVHNMFKWGKNIKEIRATAQAEKSAPGVTTSEYEEEVLASGTIPATVNNSALFSLNFAKRRQSETGVTLQQTGKKQKNSQSRP